MVEAASEETTFTASDGYPFLVESWPAVGASRGRVVALHGVQSHSGWYPGLGRRLAAAGYDVSFPNRRGSGPNQQDRGHAPSGARLIADIVEWIAHLKAQAPSTPVALAGISWGGKIALLTAVRRPDLINALALICPGLEPQVGVTFGEKLRIARAVFTNRRRTFPIPLADPALFTDDPDRREFIRNDPLGLRQATAGLLLASFLIDRQIRRAPRKLTTPTLLMLAGRDRIVDNERTRRYFARVAAGDRRIIDYPDGCHTLEFDPDPTQYADDLIAWLAPRMTSNGSEDRRASALPASH